MPPKGQLYRGNSLKGGFASSDDDLSLGSGDLSGSNHHSGSGSGSVKSFKTTTTYNYSKQEYVDPKVAEKEQKAVNASKCIMILCLLVVAAALSTATYFVLKAEEQDDFEAQVCVWHQEENCVEYYILYSVF